jgi:hypothetical protein
VSWAGPELIDGRERMSDDDWISLGLPADDDAYYDRFRDLFGLELRSG